MTSILPQRFPAAGPSSSILQKPFLPGRPAASPALGAWGKPVPTPAATLHIPAYLADTAFATLAEEQARRAQSEIQTTRGWERIGKPAQGGKAEQPLRLPSAWNPKDKCDKLELSLDGARIEYKAQLHSHPAPGSGKDETDAAAVRANYPMPPQCGLFYWEVDILSKGRDGYIGIGFCRGDVKLERLPGWDKHSWGYHGDDGHSFCCTGTGKTYGPKFTTGDTIGCGVNFRDMSAFYTKNGVMLGVAFKELESVPLYPFVGLQTPGEQVEANFGAKPFKFDIEQHMKEEKLRLWQSIDEASISPPYTSAPDPTLADTLNSLVLSYLVHHGYAGTARVFAHDVAGTKGDVVGEDDAIMVEKEAEVGESSEVVMSGVDEVVGERGEVAGVESAGVTGGVLENEEDMRNRQKIRNAILAGKIDDAITLTDSLYPGVLEDEDLIHLRLRCRRFIEMMGACGRAERRRQRRAVTARRGSSASGKGKMARGAMEDDEEEEAYESGEDAMEVDEEVNGALPGEARAGGKRRKREGEEEEEKEEGEELETEVEEDGLTGMQGLMKEAMRYGQQLQEDYRDDQREEVKKALMATFSLLAYPDPARSPAVAHLLDPAGREPVAEALNSAILVSQNRPAIPPLECIFRQSVLTNRELVSQASGRAAFVNVYRDCLL